MTVNDESAMLIASLDPEIYLKSGRTQRRMIAAVRSAITDVFDGEVELERLAGHRLRVTSDANDAAERLTRVFGIRSVDSVVEVPADDLHDLADAAADILGPSVGGHRFAVRARRMGSHEWRSKDLEIELGQRLVDGGGVVDLSNPEVTARIRIVDDRAHVTVDSAPGLGGLPAGSQGNGLMLFSGGMDSPVAAFMAMRRGVALDYLHFGMGCGQTDHAAALAHTIHHRFGAGTDPILHIAEMEPGVAAIQSRIRRQERQMALKGVMYRVAKALGSRLRDSHALITGESIGQVSTQTLANLATLDRVVDVPIIRPLVAHDKEAIIAEARRIGTFEMSARTRETCHISGDGPVSVSTTVPKLEAMLARLEDVVDQITTTTKAMRLRDWVPGG